MLLFGSEPGGRTAMFFWRTALPFRCLFQWAVVLALTAGLLLGLTTCSQAAGEPKRVVILHSFGFGFKPWSEYARAIREELDRQARWRLDIMDQLLASARVSGDNPEGPFINYLEQLYAADPLDLIITIGAPAARFVQRHRHTVFSGTPVLMGAVNQRRIQIAGMTENDTVVAVNNDHLVAFESMLRVLPATKKVMVVIGNSPSEKILREALERELKPLEGRIELEWTDNLSFEELLKSAAALPPHSAVYWFNLSVDAAGVGHEGDKALTRFHAVANAPIFSYDDSYFGRELLGGPMQSVAEGGRRIASVAVRILGGEKAGDIKTPASDFSTPKYNWLELQRWGISENRLPPGSQILFRSPTAWEQYRWQILATAAVLLLQATMITGLLYERRRRRYAETEARQRMSELAHVNRHATAGELSASIAHELNQPLGAILNNVETGAIILNSPSPDLNEIKTIFDEIKRDDQRATEVIRRLRRLLSKTASDAQDIDLNDTVGEVFDLLSAQAAERNIILSSKLAPGILRVSGDRIQLQQVILNLVVNGMDSVVGTANGRREVISSTLLSDGSARITIADSGAGVPSDKLKKVFEPFFTTKGDGMGMGLSIARTIVEAHGGRIWAENQTSGGAVFHVDLPLAKST
jgi:signal transduction histidine kinase